MRASPPRMVAVRISTFPVPSAREMVETSRAAKAAVDMKAMGTPMMAPKNLRMKPSSFARVDVKAGDHPRLYDKSAQAMINPDTIPARPQRNVKSAGNITLTPVDDDYQKTNTKSRQGHKDDESEEPVEVFSPGIDNGVEYLYNVVCLVQKIKHGMPRPGRYSSGKPDRISP